MKPTESPTAAASSPTNNQYAAKPNKVVKPKEFDGSKKNGNRTMTGSSVDTIITNPVQEMINKIGEVYDQVMSEADGQVTNDKFKLQFKNPKNDKEAVSRSGDPERKEIDLVPRMDPERDRKKDSSFFRQQQIQKKIIDEKLGKGYKSPWDKIEKAKPGIGKRIDDAVKGLKQNADDYQKILDKEKKKVSEDVAVNSAGGGGVRGLGYVSGNVDGAGDNYLDQNIANADTRDNIMKAQVKAHVDIHNVNNAKSADQPDSDTQNQIMNKMIKKVAKEETEVNEISKAFAQKFTSTMIAKHPDTAGPHPLGKDVKRKKALDLAMDKLIPSSAIHKPHVVATEEVVDERKLTPDELKDREDIAQDLPSDEFKKRYGKDWLKVKMATATNMAKKNEEVELVNEISDELIGKVNKARWLGDKKSKTPVADATRERAVNRVRDRSNVGSAPVKEDTTSEKDPVKHLEDRLNTATDKSHNGIDKLMREVAKDYNMDVHDLHDMWVKKAGCTPDEYVKENINEDLRKWFSKTAPEGNWKRINSKGEVIGPCAREPGEPKPKCMSNEKRAALSKKERAAAVRAKRKYDPNAERKGSPINVSNFGKGKISEASSWAQQAAIAIAVKKEKERKKRLKEELITEKNVPTKPDLWSRAKALARQKFDVYPSAYANGWAAKWYKSKGGGWKSQ